MEKICKNCEFAYKFNEELVYVGLVNADKEVIGIDGLCYSLHWLIENDKGSFVFYNDNGCCPSFKPSESSIVKYDTIMTESLKKGKNNE